MPSLLYGWLRPSTTDDDHNDDRKVHMCSGEPYLKFGRYTSIAFQQPEDDEENDVSYFLRVVVVFDEVDDSVAAAARTLWFHEILCHVLFQ